MKQKIIFCVIFLITGFFSCIAGINDIYAYQEQEDGLWGFCDYWGNVIVRPQYERVDGDVAYINPASELAAVKTPNGKWGFIDKKGNLKINYKYESTHNFYFGLGAVEDPNGGWGLINESGEYVIRPQYWNLVFNSIDGFWDCFKEDNVTKKHLYGLISKSGAVILPPQFDYISKFSCGLAFVKQSGKWGFIDKTGKFVIQPKYDNVYYTGFNSGLAVVETYEADKNNPWAPYIEHAGIINKSGLFIILPEYENLGTFDDGFTIAQWIVSNRRKWGYIDKSGNLYRNLRDALKAVHGR